MHPKKNRCITFWGGWKYRGLETNAMTLRHIDSGHDNFLAIIFAFFGPQNCPFFGGMLTLPDLRFPFAKFKVLPRNEPI